MAVKSSWRRVHVKCPYYRNDDGRTELGCKAILPDAAKMVTRFRTPPECSAHMERYCFGSYWNCPICTALDEKYREDER
jgi:hypothetical protein